MKSPDDAVIATRDSVESGVLILTLNRPRVLNAYDRAMRDGLFAGLTLAADDPTVTVLLLRGAGRAFCSGGDIREFGTAPSPIQAREVRQVRKVREARKVWEVFHLKIGEFGEVSIPVEGGSNFGFQSSARPAESFLFLSHEGLDLSD